MLKRGADVSRNETAVKTSERKRTGQEERYWNQVKGEAGQS